MIKFLFSVNFKFVTVNFWFTGMITVFKMKCQLKQRQPKPMWVTTTPNFFRMIPGRTITIKKTHTGLNQQHKVSLLKQRASMNFGYCQHDCVNVFVNELVNCVLLDILYTTEIHLKLWQEERETNSIVGDIFQ